MNRPTFEESNGIMHASMCHYPTCYPQHRGSDSKIYCQCAVKAITEWKKESDLMYYKAKSLLEIPTYAERDLKSIDKMKIHDGLSNAMGWINCFHAMSIADSKKNYNNTQQSDLVCFLALLNVLGMNHFGPTFNVCFGVCVDCATGQYVFKDQSMCLFSDLDGPTLSLNELMACMYTNTKLGCHPPQASTSAPSSRSSTESAARAEESADISTSLCSLQ